MGATQRTASAVAVFALALACAWARPLPARELAVPFRVIAHRGASAYAPENTLAAFEAALELGAREVELDVQLSRDGVLVLFHDSALDLKTDLRGGVRDFSAAELRGADIGSWFDRAHPGSEQSFAGTGLVSLREVFREFAGAFFYHIEIKARDESIPDRLLALIDEMELAERVMITSFSRAQLDRTRAASATVPIGWLLPPDPTDEAGKAAWLRARMDEAVSAGFQQVCVRAPELTAEGVDDARQRGLELRAWGVSGRKDMDHVIAVGGNGMTINWPDWLLERVEQIEGAER